MATHNRPITTSDRIKAHNDAVDYTCKTHTPLRGILMWKVIKWITQLVVISFGFWGGFSGAISPTLAFLGMIAVVSGVEAVESLMAIVGKDGLTVSLDTNSNGDD